MEISKEAKIGLIGFIVFSTTLFIFNYLNRQNVFSRNLIITAEFKDLNYIRKGEMVLIKGREYGKVVAIYKEGERLLVDLDIEPDTRIPKTATAVISELSLMGGHTVSIMYDKACIEGCLESGDVIPGSVYTLKEQVAEGAGPILKNIGNLADTIAGPNGMDKVLKQAYSSLHSLKKTTNKTNSQLSGLKKTFPKDIKGFRELTAALLSAKADNSKVLAENMASTREMAMALDTLLNNLSSLTQADIDSMTQLLYTAYDAAQKVPQQLESLKTNVAKADNVLDSLELSLAPYQRGQKGTVPKLLYSEPFKEDTQQSIQDLSKQVKDIRENPKKYLSLKK